MNNTEAEPRIRRKRYHQNFKRQAVELWLSGGKSASAVARELGVSARSLKIWKKQLALVPPQPTHQPSPSSTRKIAGCAANSWAR